uniref:Uncharacterized protein n=1 Tax=Ditylenchus dipsaci TaxID=166011 RepID=A0A915ESR9_9BILA
MVRSSQKVNVFVYYLLFIFSVGFAFPNINVTMNTFRLLLHQLWPQNGMDVGSGVITVMIIIWTVSYKRLVPLKYVNDTTSSITISIASSTA